MDLSVITATADRPELLAHCLLQYQQQSRGGLQCEHIVVSDGVDPHARSLAGQSGARYFELDLPQGQWGAAARDRGIAAASGTYVCFWDDDNIYHAHALVALFAAAQHVDIGVVRTEHRFRKQTGSVTIPRRWNGKFQRGDIDTMCVCVKRELARKELWELQNPTISNDYEWLQKLSLHGPEIRYLPIVIGKHL